MVGVQNLYSLASVTFSESVNMAQLHDLRLRLLVQQESEQISNSQPIDLDLSIVQARLVGLAHFAVGYIFTYAPFVIASTTGKFG